MCFSILGCMPNITRNAIVNCAELVTYDIIKDLILQYDLMTGMLLYEYAFIMVIFMHLYVSNTCALFR